MAIRPSILSSPANPWPSVFLHAGWRCGSTYVWSRFRALAGTTCFYEPFAERLAHVSPKRLGRDTAQGWDSRHPPLELPYREEFRPVLRRLRRGVRGYRESFAVQRYFPQGGARPEIAYLQRLIKHARGRGTVPVLGFSRSLARAAALKAGLGGYHIVLRRNAPQQWLSCRSYRVPGAVPYFELSHALILAHAPPDSPAARLAASLHLPHLPRWSGQIKRQLRTLYAMLGPWDDTRSYQVFIGVYLLSQALAAPAADLLLDVDRLGESSAYRAAACARIRADSSLPVDFSDARTSHHDGTEGGVDFEAIEAQIRDRLLAFGARLDPTVAAGALIQ